VRTEGEKPVPSFCIQSANPAFVTSFLEQNERGRGGGKKKRKKIPAFGSKLNGESCVSATRASHPSRAERGGKEKKK